MAYYRIMRSL